MPEGKKPRSLIVDKGTTSTGSDDIIGLFNKNVFSNPKPVQLIKYFIETFSDEGDIIADFFSGSGTTAQATMELKNRRWLLVSLPENLDEQMKTTNDKQTVQNAIDILDEMKEPHLLVNLAEERIRRAGDKIVDENPLFASKLDVGFKVFELDKSNIKKWNVDSTNLIDQIEMLHDNFESGSTPLDVVYEIMLKQGLSLTSNIIEEKVGESVLYTIEHGSMFIVLGNNINSSVANYIVDKIKELDPEDPVVVFQDQQFESDSEKLNAIEILNENAVEYDNILSI